jgi:hypothetical protein
MGALAQVVVLLGSHFDRQIAGDTMSAIGRTSDVRGRTTQKAEMCHKQTPARGRYTDLLGTYTKVQ